MAHETDVFTILAEPNRRALLDLLSGQDRPVGELVERLDISQPAVSKHLRILREAGLVESRIAAQQRVYHLRVDKLRHVDEWLAPYRWLWESRLDALDGHLDEMAKHEAAVASAEREE